MKRDNVTKTDRIKELERRVETDERQLRILSDSLMSETSTNSALRRKLVSCKKATRNTIAVANLERGRLLEQQERKVTNLKKGMEECQKTVKRNIRTCGEERRAREKACNKPKTKLKL